MHSLISTLVTSSAKRPDDMGRITLRWSHELSQYPDNQSSLGSVSAVLSEEGLQETFGWHLAK